SSDTETDVDELLAAVRVLSDPRRFQIMRSLLEAELCVCDVIDQLGVGQSLVSHHLGVLRRAGLIRARRDAQWVYYSVEPERLRVLARAFGQIFNPSSLPVAALYGASTACATVPRDPNAGPCCARHAHKTPAHSTIQAQR